MLPTPPQPTRAGKTTTPDSSQAVQDGSSVSVLILLKKMHETQMQHEAMQKVERANESVDYLDEFDKRLDDVDRRKKVVFFLSALGGATAAESVRIVLRKIATNSVWSKFSMMGQKGKKSLQDMMLLKGIIMVVMQRNKEITQKQVCDYVARSVKASPHQRGGDKYKEPVCKNGSCMWTLIYLIQPRSCDAAGGTAKVQISSLKLDSKQPILGPTHEFRWVCACVGRGFAQGCTIGHFPESVAQKLNTS